MHLRHRAQNDRTHSWASESAAGRLSMLVYTVPIRTRVPASGVMSSP